MKYIHSEAFNTCLRDYYRKSGYFQKELADELHIHEKVLSSKLKGNADKHLTDNDVKRIIIVLAKWKVFTTQEEVVRLLELAQLDARIFSEEEWHNPPLNALHGRDTLLSTPSEQLNVLAHPVYPPAHADYALSRHLQHNLLAPLTRLIGRERGRASSSIVGTG